MSTWALLGLVVVVVLVAVGIAGFLRWGRGREDDVASSEEDRPRTVADLVDRRARGLDGGSRRPAPDPSPAPPASPSPVSPVDEDPPEPEADEEQPTDRADAGAAAAVDDDPADAASATTPVAVVGPREERPRTPAVADTVEEFGPSSSAPDITEAVDASDPTDELPAVPRVTPDVSAGPVGPPWSRGFKDGKPLEPVEPAPVRRTPAPTPFVRRRAVADPAARAADEVTVAGGPGPDSSAPDISTPTSGNAVGGDTSTTATGEPAAASSEDTEGAASAGTPSAGATAGATARATAAGIAAAGAAAGAAADEKAADEKAADEKAADEGDDEVDEAQPATTVQARAPFDPDLVRRVTALPSERTAVRAPADPDTEREFREARDRISTPHTWAGRVPEQAGAPETATDTSPVSRIPSIGLAAAGGRAARETGDNPEPPPRPAPRVLRSVRPGSGPRHLAPSLRGTPAADSSPTEDNAEDTADAPTAPDDTAALDDTAAPEVAPVRGPMGDGPTEDGTTAPAPLHREPHEQGPEEQEPREQGLQEQDQQAEAPTPDPTIPERSTTAPEAEEALVHAGPTTAVRPDRAEDVALSVPRTGPAPSTVVPGTAPQDVEVRVVAATDAPLRGAEVALRDRSGGPLGSATTDADGTAQVTAPGAGAFVVVARADGYLPGVATCTVGDDQAGTTLRLVAAAAVHGSAPAGSVVVLSQDGDPVASSTAAADGTYRLTDLDPGRYLLTAGDGPGVEVELVAGDDVRHDLAG
ncbi:carboxypeptidase-like regulatory domain-containing protein [Pseudonocardia sp. Ae505_Ps2]|uniref:carboxypeptidase-like regulatory domain-containing protein n=1 Tax=Pseudonocardia sp. Ae505_Ps2 TaxID=1885034 RepID=UPI00094EE1C6|nr:carboxypeptidase-like regulatory domain-containing protein [Pseudonocardia sp. Ae505_Ps2]OLM11879.1 Fe-S oxidoreductase [Pseudonocardia sp. Ae505_Ps2]